MKDCEAHIYIKQGRHPVLDSCLPENKQYVPNDTHMNVSESRDFFFRVCNYLSKIECYKVATGQEAVKRGAGILGKGIFF